MQIRNVIFAILITIVSIVVSVMLSVNLAYAATPSDTKNATVNTINNNSNTNSNSEATANEKGKNSENSENTNTSDNASFEDIYNANADNGRTSDQIARDTLSALSANLVPITPSDNDPSEHIIFTDVANGKWYYDIIYDVYERGYMTGYAGTKLFGPENSLTRAQISKIFYNMAGKPVFTPENTNFTDVDPKADLWWTVPALWCEKQGLIHGYQHSDGTATFVWDNSCTRQEFITILYNKAQHDGRNATVEQGAQAWIDRFYDKDDVSDWAKEAIGWGISRGIIAQAGEIAPNRAVTRAEAAAMVMRYQVPLNVPSDPSEVGTEFFPWVVPAPEPEPPQLSERDIFVNEWASRIDNYMRGYPLYGYGRVFAEAAYDYGLDPRYSPAISRIESSSGKYCFRSYNAWGFGNYSWPNWETAIREHIRLMAKGGYGYSISYNDAARYCPPGGAWFSQVSSEMNRI